MYDIFMAYAKHTQECEDVINYILREYVCGNTNFTIDLDDQFDETDVAYIEREVQRRVR